MSDIIAIVQRKYEIHPNKAKIGRYALKGVHIMQDECMPENTIMLLFCCSTVQ